MLPSWEPKGGYMHTEAQQCLQASSGGECCISWWCYTWHNLWSSSLSMIQQPFLSFPWTVTGLDTFWWFVFSWQLMFYKPQPHVLHLVKRNRWGDLFVFTIVLAQQTSHRLNAGLLGISRSLSPVHWINGLGKMWGLTLSFKLSLQWRFNMVHFLAFLSVFQNTSCACYFCSARLSYLGLFGFFFFKKKYVIYNSMIIHL